VPPAACLACAVSILSCGVLRDTRTPRWEIMMTMSLEDICLLQKPTVCRAPWDTCAAPELHRARRRDLEPRDTWRLRSCPVVGGGSWRNGARGSTRAGTRELEPQDTWQHLSCPEPKGGSWRHPSCPCRVA
jgi:hypothetical protein